MSSVVIFVLIFLGLEFIAGLFDQGIILGRAKRRRLKESKREDPALESQLAQIDQHLDNLGVRGRITDLRRVRDGRPGKKVLRSLPRGKM